MNNRRKKVEMNISTIQLICDLLTYYVEVPKISVLFADNIVPGEIHLGYNGDYPVAINMNFQQLYMDNEEDAKNILFSIAYAVGISYGIKQNVSCTGMYSWDHCDAYNMNCDSCSAYYEYVMGVTFAKYVCHKVYGELPSNDRCPSVCNDYTKYDEPDMLRIIKEDFAIRRKTPYIFNWIWDMLDYALFS